MLTIVPVSHNAPQRNLDCVKMNFWKSSDPTIKPREGRKTPTAAEKKEKVTKPVELRMAGGSAPISAPAGTSGRKKCQETAIWASTGALRTMG